MQQRLMRMKMKTIETYLTRNKWGTKDFRDIKTKLFYSVQEKQKDFHPLLASTYKDNPIQLIDFFSGAGGTSLGFASVNHVIPAFKMLGDTDGNCQAYAGLTVFQIAHVGLGNINRFCQALLRHL